jgi:hypothetical protein
VAVSATTRHLGRKGREARHEHLKYAEGSFHRSGQAKPEQSPKHYPLCLACGFQHPQASHCDGCNGDHSAGYYMTDELAAQLANVGELQARVARAADHLFAQVLHMMRAEGGQ